MVNQKDASGHIHQKTSLNTIDPDKEIITSDNIRFGIHDVPYRQITEVLEYRFDDLRPGDRVVDIGANVGAFCIRAALRSNHVVAVEPVSVDILLENIRLNDVSVKVIKGALGDGKSAEICWDECRMIAPTFPLHAIIEIAGGCDFLKCDCEGAEWFINPEDLAGVRRIEMELHIPPIGGPPNPALLEYISGHYDFEIDRTPCHGPMGVMGVLHAERRTEPKTPRSPV